MTPGRRPALISFSRFGGPEVLEIVDLPDPRPGPGKVRIAVRAAGVNASDWKKRNGLMDAELPQTLGYEAAGVVDELGEGVAGVAVGDRVFGFSAEGGAQAELAVLSWYALPELIELAGGPQHVITIADFDGARQYGVRFSSGDSGRALHALSGISALIESGCFSLPVARTFPLAEVAEAHRVGEQGHARGKLVLLAG
jgi:NADPH:quinone reductase-like Zn-dependent oxidoreductase